MSYYHQSNTGNVDPADIHYTYENAGQVIDLPAPRKQNVFRVAVLVPIEVGTATPRYRPVDVLVNLDHVAYVLTDEIGMATGRVFRTNGVPTQLIAAFEAW
jgi:hypothetical protein